MSRPRNADGQRTRQAILDAALELFAEKGFFGTTLRDVAAAVGVRESALYNYFPGKDALFEALVLTDHEEKTELLSALAEEPVGDARVALERFAAALLASYARRRQQQVFRILMSDGIRLAREGRLNLLERMGNDGRGPVHVLLRRLMREGSLRDGDLKTLVVAFVSPLLLWRQLRAIDADMPLVKHPEEFVRLHVEQFLGGAAAPASRRPPRRRLRDRSAPPARRAAPARRLP